MVSPFTECESQQYNSMFSYTSFSLSSSSIDSLESRLIVPTSRIPRSLDSLLVSLASLCVKGGGRKE